MKPSATLRVDGKSCAANLKESAYHIIKCEVEHEAQNRALGMVGLIVSGCWMILALAIPISEQPVLWGLARLTCPIVPVSMALHFGVKWYWVSVSNVIVYALIGLIVEALLQSRNRFQAAQR